MYVYIRALLFHCDTLAYVSIRASMVLYVSVNASNPIAIRNITLASELVWYGRVASEHSYSIAIRDLILASELVWYGRLASELVWYGRLASEHSYAVLIAYVSYVSVRASPARAATSVRRLASRR